MFLKNHGIHDLNLHQNKDVCREQKPTATICLHAVAQQHATFVFAVADLSQNAFNHLSEIITWNISWSSPI